MLALGRFREPIADLIGQARQPGRRNLFAADLQEELRHETPPSLRARRREASREAIRYQIASSPFQTMGLLAMTTSSRKLRDRRHLRGDVLRGHLAGELADLQDHPGALADRDGPAR